MEHRIIKWEIRELNENSEPTSNLSHLKDIEEAISYSLYLDNNMYDI